MGIFDKSANDSSEEEELGMGLFDTFDDYESDDSLPEAFRNCEYNIMSVPPTLFNGKKTTYTEMTQYADITIKSKY